MQRGIKLLYLVGLMGFCACSGGKYTPLNEDPALRIVEAYWQEIVPGQEDGIKTIVLFLPITENVAGYDVDSVYFKGYHDALKPYDTPKNRGFRATFSVVKDRTVIQPPYVITENAALISYTDENSKKRYFKVENIVQAESIFMP